MTFVTKPYAEICLFKPGLRVACAEIVDKHKLNEEWTLVGDLRTYKKR